MRRAIRHDPIGAILAFRRDPLELIMRLHAESRQGVSRLVLGPFRVAAITDPALAIAVLKDQTHFDRETRATKVVRGLIGSSLLNAQGDLWRARRRLMQPYFNTHSIADYVGEMASHARAVVADWELRRLDEPVDLHRAMVELSLKIIQSALFGVQPQGESEIADAVRVAVGHVYRRIGNPFMPPDAIPTCRNRRYRAAVDQLSGRIGALIEQSRRGELPEDRLLHKLTSAQDEETGAFLTDVELRNELLTLMLAGHETSAVALTWFFYWMMHHPNHAETIADEVERLPETIDLDCLKSLRFTGAALDETLRLCPPIWVMLRRVRENVRMSVGADSLLQCREGDRVAISPFGLHRDPALWSEPLAFRPERFLDGPPAVEGAFLPFGAGPHHCIGHRFARAEILIAIAEVMRSGRIRSVHPVPEVVAPVAEFSLVPGRPIPIRYEAVRSSGR